MEYSAGLTSKPFWFVESKKTAELMTKGMSKEEVKDIAIKENIYQVSKEYRVIEILNGTHGRLALLPLELLEMLPTIDVSSAKIIVLVAVMRSNRLFFEFVNEVYREKIILHEKEITDRDINVFFADKAMQSAEIGRWTEISVSKLKATMPRFLYEAGLLTDSKKDRKLADLNIDHKLKEILKAKMKPCYTAITGE